jgi:hypothetical protein
MRIRILVPALACLAAAPFAAAADTVPAVKIDGFVDSIWSNTNPEKGNAVGATSGFDFAGKLGLAATISDKVAAQVDLNVSNSGDVTSRQAYGTWAINDEIGLKTGKFISNYGWTAAYAPGLYRINGGPITAFYGVDQVGADVKYTKGAIAAAVTVANGFFGEGTGATAQTTGQDAGAYAFGLDLVYTHEMAVINLELITDQDVGNGSDADGYHVGLNVQATPSKELTVAGELIMQSVNQKGFGAEDSQNFGIMALANYKLGTAMPMSVTGQISMVDIEEGASYVTSLAGVSVASGDDVTATEFAVALLTNPAGTDKLGANLEVNYTMSEKNGADEEYKLGIAAELLYVF